MKKNLLITLLILFATSVPSKGAELIKSPEDLETLFEETFYESPTSFAAPKVEVQEGSNIKPVMRKAIN